MAETNSPYEKEERDDSPGETTMAILMYHRFHQEEVLSNCGIITGDTSTTTLSCIVSRSMLSLHGCLVTNSCTGKQHFLTPFGTCNMQVNPRGITALW